MDDTRPMNPVIVCSSWLLIKTLLIYLQEYLGPLRHNMSRGRYISIEKHPNVESGRIYKEIPSLESRRCEL